MLSAGIDVRLSRLTLSNISSPAAFLSTGFRHQTARKQINDSLTDRRSLMAQNDLTISEVLKDPLIRTMMRADRISVKAMKSLLSDAASKQEIHVARRRMKALPVAGPAKLQLPLHRKRMQGTTQPDDNPARSS
jgi:hypothetical protein